MRFPTPMLSLLVDSLGRTLPASRRRKTPWDEQSVLKWSVYLESVSWEFVVALESWHSEVCRSRWTGRSLDEKHQYDRVIKWTTEWLHTIVARRAWSFWALQSLWSTDIARSGRFCGLETSYGAWSQGGRTLEIIVSALARRLVSVTHTARGVRSERKRSP